MARQRKPVDPNSTMKRAEAKKPKRSNATKLPSVQQNVTGKPAVRPREKPEWKDPTPKATVGFPPLSSAACVCADCRSIRPERISWPPAKPHRQLHAFSRKDSYALHTSSSVSVLRPGLADSFGTYPSDNQQCLAAARTSFLCRNPEESSYQAGRWRKRPMGATSRLSKSLHLPVIPPKQPGTFQKPHPMFGRPSNRPITVPKPVANTRLPQLTTRLPPIPRGMPQATTELSRDDTSDDFFYGAEDNNFDESDDYMYDVESFCSESLLSFCSDDSDADDSLGEFGEAATAAQVRQREVELSQLQDFARWAKSFGGGEKGLSVASFLQEWRDLRRVGGNDAQSEDVRRMAERLMNGESVMEEIISRHIPPKKSQQQEHLEQIERIRRDLVAMRKRRALQQQESAFLQEKQRGGVLSGLGQHMSAQCDESNSKDSQ